MTTEKTSANYRNLFEWMGGEEKIQILVDRFYDLMDLEPAYARLRSLHKPDLQHSRDTLFWFLCGWTGGPRYYEERYGHPRLRMRHLHVPITPVESGQWMACMRQAMRECELEPDLQQVLDDNLSPLAEHMENQYGH